MECFTRWLPRLNMFVDFNAFDVETELYFEYISFVNIIIFQ